MFKEVVLPLAFTASLAGCSAQSERPATRETSNRPTADLNAETKPGTGPQPASTSVSKSYSRASPSTDIESSDVVFVVPEGFTVRTVSSPDPVGPVGSVTVALPICHTARAAATCEIGEYNVTYPGMLVSTTPQYVVFTTALPNLSGVITAIHTLASTPQAGSAEPAETWCQDGSPGGNRVLIDGSTSVAAANLLTFIAANCRI